MEQFTEDNKRKRRQGLRMIVLLVIINILAFILLVIAFEMRRLRKFEEVLHHILKLNAKDLETLQLELRSRRGG